MKPSTAAILALFVFCLGVGLCIGALALLIDYAKTGDGVLAGRAIACAIGGALALLWACTA